MKIANLFAMLLATVSLQALAQIESDYVPHLQRNSDEQRAFEEGCDTNQLDINLCSYYDFKVLDEHLNAVYKRLREQIRNDPQATQRLTLAQRAWLNYVETDCLYQNGKRLEAGSGWPADQNTCLSAHYKARIALLEQFLR